MALDVLLDALGWPWTSFWSPWMLLDIILEALGDTLDLILEAVGDLAVMTWTLSCPSDARMR